MNGIPAMLQLVWQVAGGGIRAQKRRLILSLLLRIAASISLLGPYYIQEIIDRALPARDLHLFWKYGLLLLLVHAISYIFWAIQVYLSYAASETIFLELRSRLIQTLLNKPKAFFNRHPAGDLVVRLVHDVDYVAGFFYQNLLRSLAYLVFCLVLIGFMILWNWKLGLLSLITLPMLYLYTAHTNLPMARRAEVSKMELSRQNEILLDLIHGHGEIRYLQQQKHAYARFQEAASRYAQANIYSNTFGEWVWGGVDALGLLMVLFPFLIGSYLVCLGDATMTTGLLVAFYAYLANLAGKAQFLFGGIALFAQAVPSLRRIQEVLDFQEEDTTPVACLDDVPNHTTIEFEHVTFKYPSGLNIFRDLNLRIEPGEKIAVMGPSGSGKSTLAGLLLRFLQTTGGAIRLGDRRVEDYSLAFYYSYFGYVSQKTTLFNLSVRENIAMGWTAVPLERIREVCETVRLRETVENLPQGYETLLGEKGAQLSGGQMQRIALARALVRDPAILVLDEFTSALDRHVEREILNDIFTALSGQTIICITHSPIVAGRFQRILYLPCDEGP